MISEDVVPPELYRRPVEHIVLNNGDKFTVISTVHFTTGSTWSSRSTPPR
ncbi:hypothetical protein OHB05_39640 [Streptomyces sp. NBC_00638]|nr:hypothetical protein [Streptomyces sp. NBC_00638]MCX5008655.1 hypothetical protein [Streptomyces sp. NBC_00638]